MMEEQVQQTFPRPLFDSHCHVNEERFDEDREEVLARMRAYGVTRYAVIGSDMATSAACVAYCRSHEDAVCAVGIHPHEAKTFREGNLETLAAWIRSGEARAIGEIGLDYYYDLSPRETQQRVCRAQMELAWELRTAAAFHVRDAHQDLLEIMKSMRKHLTPGIIHCFSGSAEIAKEYLKLGYCISFAGPVTFKKAPRLREAALLVPADRLLIETDSPYMAPEPVRGTRNEPANVRFVAEKLAEIRQEPADVLAAATFENALRIYGLK